MAEPSLEQWHALYAAAIDLQKLAPWQWMNGDDLFAVENPTTGEVGYANVMG